MTNLLRNISTFCSGPLGGLSSKAYSSIYGVDLLLWSRFYQISVSFASGHILLVCYTGIRYWLGSILSRMFFWYEQEIERILLMLNPPPDRASYHSCSQPSVSSLRYKVVSCLTGWREWRACCLANRQWQAASGKRDCQPKEMCRRSIVLLRMFPELYHSLFTYQI